MSSFRLIDPPLTSQNKKRGWEPDAVLNWAVLSGWGAVHDAPVDAKAESQAAFVPDSTRVMNLGEMIEKVCLSSEIASICVNFGLVRYLRHYPAQYNSGSLET